MASRIFKVTNHSGNKFSSFEICLAGLIRKRRLQKSITLNHRKVSENWMKSSRFRSRYSKIFSEEKNRENNENRPEKEERQCFWKRPLCKTNARHFFPIDTYSAQFFPYSAFQAAYPHSFISTHNTGSASYPTWIHYLKR